MEKYLISPNVLLQINAGKVVLYDMATDDLLSIEGDVALLTQFVHRESAKKNAVGLEEIKQHLLGVSTQFKQNPAQDQSIQSALSFFSKSGLMVHAS